jgi:drug/metabolite transporter (DMT)-like permease
MRSFRTPWVRPWHWRRVKENRVNQHEQAGTSRTSPFRCVGVWILRSVSLDSAPYWTCTASCYSVPLITALAGVWLLQEALTIRLLIAADTIVIGIALE